MKNSIVNKFQTLLGYFPVIEPPLTISEETAVSFSSKNKAIPNVLIFETISNWEDLDEYTEIVPCFQLSFSKEFKTIIYWKGGLMVYEYVLVNFLDDGTMLSKKVIAGTLSNGQTIRRSVANIDADYVIRSAVGESFVKKEYNPENTKTYNFEILGDGSVSSTEEEHIWEEDKNQDVKN